MKLATKNGEITLPDSQEAASRYVADLILNGGKIEDEGVSVDWSDGYRWFSPKFQDTTTSKDIRPLLKAAVEIIVREPAEPLLTINPLFTRVNVPGMQTQVLGGAMGAVVADDVPEGGTYPEVMFQVGGAMQTATVGKSGIQASFTDEALRYSTWDIMAMNLRQMGAALARHKERKAASFLSTIGTELFNNLSPSTSLLGVCTGRGLDGLANGSATAEDIFKGMAHMAEEGFNPDVMLINPQFFYAFIQDPVLRAFMINHGGGAWFQKWSGVAGPRDPWSNGAQGAAGVSPGNKIVPGGSPSGGSATGIAGREHGMTATPPFPTSYFPWPFTVLISPLVPFDADAQTGTIYLLSSGDVGLHLVDEDPVTVEWRDESRDISKIRIRERYGYNVAYEGQGVGVMKNVKLARNYWDGTLSAVTHDIDSEIDPSTPLSL